jgi:hypothetical protein
MWKRDKAWDRKRKAKSDGADERYFMDDDDATEFQHRCRVRALVGAAICLLLLLVLWLSGVFGR